MAASVRTDDDWIAAWDATHPQHPYALKCLRCGLVQPITTPISITAYVRIGKAFRAEHARCKAQDPSPKAQEATREAAP